LCNITETPTDAIGALPKPNQVWWVKHKGAMALVEAKIFATTRLTVTLANKCRFAGFDSRHTCRRSDVEFVEVIVE